MSKPNLLVTCIILFVAVVLCITASVFWLEGNGDADITGNDNSINWQMNAWFVSADDRRVTMNITIQGILHDNGDSPDKLEDLIITYPDEFSYAGHRYKGTDPISNLNQEFNVFPRQPDLFYSAAIAYHKQTETMSTENWAICFDKGFYISLFECEPNCYLVASTSNETEPEEIIEYFADFIDTFSRKHWDS